MGNIIIFLVLTVLTSLAGVPVLAQATTDHSAERELARLAVEAHGGDKLREMKTLIVNGTVNVTAAQFPQAIGGTFVTVFKGEQYRFELNSPLQAVKQVSNGRETSSSLQGGFTLPPVNRLGFPLLQRIGETGFIVTALPEARRKRKGFRVTSPEGFFTDFYLDDRTNQIRAYDATYVVQGRMVTTSVEVDRLKSVEGVLVPERYVQRFDLDQFTIYASFRAREIKVNAEVDDDVFTLGN
jgi:hypothetical protein